MSAANAKPDADPEYEWIGLAHMLVAKRILRRVVGLKAGQETDSAYRQALTEEIQLFTTGVESEITKLCRKAMKTAQEAGQ